MPLPQSLYDMLENPATLGLCTLVGMFLSPLCAAFFVGVIVGWLWKPKWARLGKEKLTTSLVKSLDFASPSSASSPSKSVVSTIKSCYSSPCLSSIKMQRPNPESLALKKGTEKKTSSSSSPVKFASSVRYFLIYPLFLCYSDNINSCCTNTGSKSIYFFFCCSYKRKKMETKEIWTYCYEFVTC